jgi:hypothetical protein
LFQRGVLTIIRRVALTTVLAGAAGSTALMLHAGRRQRSQILILLFGIWVLSPFIAALFAASASKRWAAATQVMFCVWTVALSLGSLAIYGGVAFEYVNAKIGFVFLVVPLASWLLFGVVLGAAALISVKAARRPQKA